MVQPLPRLRPEIEASIIAGHHNRARESVGVEAAIARAGQTALQREEGDRRFDLHTHTGRERILDEIPALLQERFRGEPTLLEVLARYGTPPEPTPPVQVFDSPTRIFISLRDLQAHNLRSSVHDRIVESILSEWARTVGVAYMAAMATRATVGPTMAEAIETPCRAWVAPAEIAVALRRLDPGLRVIAVPTWGPLVRVDRQSALVSPDFGRLEIRRMEYNDRWAISITAPLRFWWTPERGLAAFHVDRPSPEGLAEVVR